MKKTFQLLLSAALLIMTVSCKKDDPVPVDPVDTIVPDQPEHTAQAVNITYDEVGTVSFTASFAKTDTCVSYHVMAAEPGTTEQYLPIFGYNTVNEAVADWGVECSSDTTYTWDELVPNSPYVVYVLAHCTHGDVLITDTVKTATLGGHGTSIISVSVSNVTGTNVTTVATPNDQTAMFKDFIISKVYYDSIGRDSAVALLKEDYYSHYSTDTWTWLSLDPFTEYYFMAIGQNADGVWGEVSMTSFSTTAAKSSTKARRHTTVVTRKPAISIKK